MSLRDQISKLAQEKPPLRKHLVPLLREATGPVRVKKVEIINSPQDFFETQAMFEVGVTFEVEGDALAPLLGVQRRVLMRALEKMKSGGRWKSLFDRMPPKAEKLIMPTVIKAAEREVGFIMQDEAANNEFSRWRFPRGLTTLTESDSYWEAKFFPAQEKAEFYLEFDVMVDDIS